MTKWPLGLAGGFSLVELTVIIMLIGILAIMVMPRFADRTGFDARGFHDATASILRYAQKSAVAQRRSVCVAFTAGSVTLMMGAAFGAACSVGLPGPDGSSPYSLNAPPGVAFVPTPTNFSFLPSGAASAGQSFGVTGLTGRSITVYATTGHVEQN
jgi:MSHA pilin protein MshC